MQDEGGVSIGGGGLFGVAVRSCLRRRRREDPPTEDPLLWVCANSYKNTNKRKGTRKLRIVHKD